MEGMEGKVFCLIMAIIQAQEVFYLHVAIIQTIYLKYWSAP